METEVRNALKTQYRAALATLRQAIERCPDDLWVKEGKLPTFWQIAYHALFYAHLYMMPDLDSFVPWAKHRDEHESMEVPTPSGQHPYTQSELLEYCDHVASLVDATVDRLDLASPTCGFYWYRIPKLDHEILSIRHVEQHVGQLDALLRLEGLEALDWQT